jgi:hypothetical protein
MPPPSHGIRGQYFVVVLLATTIWPRHFLCDGSLVLVSKQKMSLLPLAVGKLAAIGKNWEFCWSLKEVERGRSFVAIAAADGLFLAATITFCGWGKMAEC